MAWAFEHTAERGLSLSLIEVLKYRNRAWDGDDTDGHTVLDSIVSHVRRAHGKDYDLLQICRAHGKDCDLWIGVLATLLANHLAWLDDGVSPDKCPALAIMIDDEQSRHESFYISGMLSWERAEQVAKDIVHCVGERPRPMWREMMESRIGWCLL